MTLWRSSLTAATRSPPSATSREASVIAGDASYFVALADGKDRWHADAERIRRTVPQEFLVSDLVDAADIAFAEEALLNEAMGLHLRHDGRLSVSDCVSVALMGRRGIRDIVSFDSDFDRVRGIRRIG